MPVPLVSPLITLTRRPLADMLWGVTMSTAGACAVLLALLGHAEDRGHKLAWFLGLVVCPLAPGLATMALSRAAPSHGRVSLDGDTLRVERDGVVETFPRSAILDAHVAGDHDDGATLEMRLPHGRELRVAAGSWDDAVRWLDAVGITTHRHARRYALGTRGHSVVWAALGLTVLGGPLAVVVMTALSLLAAWLVPAWQVHDSTLLAASWPLSAWFVWRWGRPATIVVGVDGVAVEAFRRRFVPMCEVADAQMEVSGGFVLTRVDGRKLTVVANGRRHRGADAVHAIARRKRRAVTDAHAASLARLDRDGRTAAAWRKAFDAHGTAPAAFRGLSLDRETLLAALEEPGGDPERRVGAVLALRDDESAQTRVRVAIEACADDSTREAMRAAAHDTLADEHLDALARAKR